MYLSIAVSPNNSTNKDSFGCCTVDMFLSATFVTMIRTSNVGIEAVDKKLTINELDPCKQHFI